MNEAVSKKTLHIFLPPMSAEYVTVFSGRTDAPEVRFDLTDTQRHTDLTLAAHAHRGLMITTHMYMYMDYIVVYYCGREGIFTVL